MKEKLIKIRQELSKTLYNLTEFQSDKGIILCSELAEGAELKRFSESGEIIQLEDGEYTINEQVIKCSNGVYDLGEPPHNDEPIVEETVEPTEEPTVEEPIVEPTEEQVTLSKVEHDALLAEIEELKENVVTLSEQPVVELVDDKASTSTTETKVELRGMAKYSQYIK